MSALNLLRRVRNAVDTGEHAAARLEDILDDPRMSRRLSRAASWVSVWREQVEAYEVRADEMYIEVYVEPDGSARHTRRIIGLRPNRPLGRLSVPCFLRGASVSGVRVDVLSQPPGMEIAADVHFTTGAAQWSLDFAFTPEQPWAFGAMDLEISYHSPRPYQPGVGEGSYGFLPRIHAALLSLDIDFSVEYERRWLDPVAVNRHGEDKPLRSVAEGADWKPRGNMGARLILTRPLPGYDFKMRWAAGDGPCACPVPCAEEGVR